MAFTSAALITPLGAVTLACNAIVAPIFLGEAFGRSDVFGTIIIIGGTVLTVLFGDHGDPRALIVFYMGIFEGFDRY